MSGTDLSAEIQLHHQGALEQYAQGQKREAHAALAEAFALAQGAESPATLALLWQTAGDFAFGEDFIEAAHDAYTNALNGFTEAQDADGVQRMEEKLAGLGRVDPGAGQPQA